MKTVNISHSLPIGSIAVKRFHGNEWTFEFPRLRPEVYEFFRNALDLRDAGDAVQAEKDLRLLVEGYPEFIDAFHHLAIILYESDRYSEASEYWQYAVEVGLQAVPETFKVGSHRLPWIILENRPFLRAYHSWGLKHLNCADIQTASSIFQTILAMNPNDNQGIRSLLVDCYFRLNKPNKVLQVCKQFRDDTMAEILYGRPLALLQSGQRDGAIRSLYQAIEFLPNVAKELIKTRHPVPKEVQPDSVTMGGKDQAYYYWQQQGEHWKNTSNAIEVVKECLSSLKNCK